MAVSAPAMQAPHPGAAEPEPEPETFDPADHTIEAVKAYVADHADELAAVLDAERSGKARTTLITWLEAEEESNDT